LYGLTDHKSSSQPRVPVATSFLDHESNDNTSAMPA
jgi:hypothetical protein